MNLFSAQGQLLTQIETTLLNDLVRTAEKLNADNADLKELDVNQKLVIEHQGIRIIELEDTLDLMKEQIAKIKIAYADIADKNRKGKFWVWIKGVGAGIVIGAGVIVVLLL